MPGWLKVAVATSPTRRSGWPREIFGEPDPGRVSRSTVALSLGSRAVDPRPRRGTSGSSARALAGAAEHGSAVRYRRPGPLSWSA